MLENYKGRYYFENFEFRFEKCIYPYLKRYKKNDEYVLWGQFRENNG